jgi:hypothetical protein
MIKHHNTEHCHKNRKSLAINIVALLIAIASFTITSFVLSISPRSAEAKSEIQNSLPVRTANQQALELLFEPDLPVCPVNTTKVSEFGTFELAEYNVPSSARVTFNNNINNKNGVVIVYQGEGHGWDGCQPSGNNSGNSRCSQNQPNEQLKFSMNGALIGQFDDHSPADNQTYLYQFVFNNLKSGSNNLDLQHVMAGTGINSVYTKGVVCVTAPTAPTATVTASPTPRPTLTPTASPTISVTIMPPLETATPTATPTETPTVTPTRIPTWVKLESFSVRRMGSSMVLRWTTSGEFNTQGYSIYRSVVFDPVSTNSFDRNNATLMTPQMIESQGGPTHGASYQWVDTMIENNARYAYWLVETEFSGKQNEYGPASWVEFKTYLPLISR